MKSGWKQGRNDTGNLRVTLWSSPSGGRRERECAMITGSRNPNEMALSNTLENCEPTRTAANEPWDVKYCVPIWTWEMGGFDGGTLSVLP